MYNKKNLFIIGFFIALSSFVIVTGLVANKDARKEKLAKYQDIVEKAYFKDVYYFKLENQKEVVELQSDFLDITDNYLLRFRGPNGNLTGEKSSYLYSAQTGEMNQKTQILKLKGDVTLSDENSDYAFGELIYNGLKKEIEGFGGVAAQVVDEKTLDILKIKSKTLKSNLDKKIVNMSGEVKGELIRQRAYEGGLKFFSEQLDLNSPESRMKLTKSVKLYRNNYYLQAENAEIFLENFNKKLKYYELYDDVKLEEKLTLASGKKQTRRAFAEKLESHQRAGKLVLTGAPRVEQGSDVIKGYQITLRENVELVEVDDSQSNFNLKRKE